MSRAHQSLEQLRAGAALSTWLFRIATHVSVDCLRKRERQPFVVDEIEPNEPTTLDEPPLRWVAEQFSQHIQESIALFVGTD